MNVAMQFRDAGAEYLKTQVAGQCCLSLSSWFELLGYTCVINRKAATQETSNESLTQTNERKVGCSTVQ